MLSLNKQKVFLKHSENGQVYNTTGIFLEIINHKQKYKTTQKIPNKFLTWRLSRLSVTIIWWK
jgi:hypothetical protein